MRPNEAELAAELKNIKNDDYQKWADSLRKADERANKLKEEVRASQDIQSQLEDKIGHLEIQVRNRDKEIDRLQTKLDVTGLNTEKIANDFNLKSAQEKIDKLNSQIDFLSRQNFSLED